ncbi:MAG: MFS transporter [Comamonadaceae bacterium]|nr:MAG: MFS transporter [Comamonadaceae bacterium]
MRRQANSPHAGGARAAATRSALMPVAAVVAAALVNQAANGALQVHLPLRMHAAGVAMPWIGAVASAFAAGFLLGCFAAAHLLRRLGQVRTFALGASLQAGLTLALLAGDDPLLWTILRFLTGAAGACVAVVYESWINARTPAALRGRVFGLYNVLNRLSQLGGQGAAAALALAGATVPVLFFGALFALSLLPLRPVRLHAPAGSAGLRAAGWPPLHRLARVAPVGLWAACHAGLVGSLLVAMLPVYGRAAGLDAAAAAWMAVAPQAGCLLTQWALGSVADRHGALRAIGLAAAGACVAAMAMQAWPPGPAAPLALALLAGVLGASVLPGYALSLTHAAQRLSGSGLDAVDLSAGLLASWSIGSIVGPVAVAWAMQRWGAIALPAVVLGSSAITGLAACIAARARPPRP